MTHKVVIIGAGAAGVFTAYRLREMYGHIYDIVLLERNDHIGGNAFTTHVEYGGSSYSIDCGAQFFYKNAQVSYVELLDQLGLFDWDDDREIVAAPSGFTIWDRAADGHRFYIPSRLSGLLDYDGDDWARLLQFGHYLAYCYVLDRGDTAWTLSVDDWLAQLHLLSDDFKEKVVKPFMYQFVTLPSDRIGEASARYAVTYFVRNLLGEPRVDEPDPEMPNLPGLPVFETYQSLIGLDGVLDRALRAANIQPRLSCNVRRVRTDVNGLVVETDGGNIAADHVVLASDPQVAANLLEGLAPEALLATLRQMEYVALPISLQKDGSCYMPRDRKYWQPVNTIIDGADLMFSAWFGPLRAPFGDGERIPVFKSWGSTLKPEACPHRFETHEHRILQPTVAFMAAREALRAWQGQQNIWFAGGWTNWFDSQEAALDSATSVANALPGAPLPRTGRMVAVDPELTKHNLQRWLDRMARQAPEPAIGDALDRVEHEG
jgi:hypothetical protein